VVVEEGEEEEEEGEEVVVLHFVVELKEEWMSSCHQCNGGSIDNMQQPKFQCKGIALAVRLD
jgi:hypothetical protein